MILPHCVKYCRMKKPYMPMKAPSVMTRCRSGLTGRLHVTGNGMIKTDSWVKHYKGVDMPHDRFVVRQ